MIKESIQEENITIVNIYATNIGAPQYIRQTLTDIKGKISSNTIILGNFNKEVVCPDECSMCHLRRICILPHLNEMPRRCELDSSEEVTLVSV